MTDKTFRLGINIDHVATLRQARASQQPDIIEAAKQAMAGGADGITIHLRFDRRHIQDADLEALTQLDHVPINLEMAITEEMLAIAEKCRPEHVCLVPEKPEELTTEGGLDVIGQKQAVEAAIKRLKAAGIQPAIFINPDPEQIKAAAQVGAEAIEVHTGNYSYAQDDVTRQHELERVEKAVQVGHELGLEIHAGHGLSVANVEPIAKLEPVVELNIGFSLVARSIFVGLKTAVSEMRAKLASIH